VREVPCGRRVKFDRDASAGTQGRVEKVNRQSVFGSQVTRVIKVDLRVADAHPTVGPLCRAVY